MVSVYMYGLYSESQMDSAPPVAYQRPLHATRHQSNVINGPNMILCYMPEAI